MNSPGPQQELATGMPKAGGSYCYVNHALGVAWYWFYAGDRAVKPSLVGEAIAVPAASGAREAMDRYRIVMAVANPETERGLLRLAAQAVEGRETPEDLGRALIGSIPERIAGRAPAFLMA